MQRTTAIVLKRIPAREFDDLVVCYTRDEGKRVYHAKSIRRRTSKQASHLDILNCVEFTAIPASGYPIIASAHCTRGYPSLKSSLPALAAAHVLLEHFDALVFEHDADERLWRFLHEKLAEYEATAAINGNSWYTTVQKHTAELVTLLGYAPDMLPEHIAQRQLYAFRFALNVLQS